MRADSYETVVNRMRADPGDLAREKPVCESPLKNAVDQSSIYLKRRTRDVACSA